MLRECLCRRSLSKLSRSRTGTRLAFQNTGMFVGGQLCRSFALAAGLLRCCTKSCTICRLVELCLLEHQQVRFHFLAFRGPCIKLKEEFCFLLELHKGSRLLEPLLCLDLRRG